MRLYVPVEGEPWEIPDYWVEPEAFLKGHGNEGGLVTVNLEEGIVPSGFVHFLFNNSAEKNMAAQRMLAEETEIQFEMTGGVILESETLWADYLTTT